MSLPARADAPAHVRTPAQRAVILLDAFSQYN